MYEKCQIDAPIWVVDAQSALALGDKTGCFPVQRQRRESVRARAPSIPI